MNRRAIGAELKGRVALEAIKGELTMAEISSKYEVHATQINRWKKQLMAGIPALFFQGKDRAAEDQRGLIEDLYKQIGQLKVENEWLKKKSERFGS